MKKTALITTVLGSFLFVNTAFANVHSELDIQYETVRFTSDMIVDANRTILKSLPCERELAKTYSATQLAKMLTQLKNVMSTNTDHLEILLEITDSLYNELKK